MKGILLSFCMLGHLILSAQDMSDPADSLARMDTVRISPYLEPATSRSLGNFAVLTKDQLAFQTNAGFNVINTLRGHTPNLDIGPNYTGLVPSIRMASSHLVIDGLPYIGQFASYYNLNAFDFQSVSALSSGNASAVYGGAATGGAFIIESKSGKDVSKPTVEVNSTTSSMWVDNQTYLTGLPNDGETIKQWRFTNAVAVMKDFGAVDTRISYMNAQMPDASTDGDTRTTSNNIKVNTGVDIVRGLRARLIFDHNSWKNTSAHDQTKTSNVYKNTLGNLLITYDVLDWLTISSQSSLAKLTTDAKTPTYLLEDDFTRRFANLFVSFKKSLGQKFRVTAFSGVQYEKTEEHREIPASAFRTRNYITKTWTSGVGVQLMNAWFVDYTYRYDDLDMIQIEESWPSTYSLSTALNVLDLFGIANNTFSGIRLRGSYGKTFYSPLMSYPIRNAWVFQTPNEKRMREVGLDVSFVKDRIKFSTNYFYNIDLVTTTYTSDAGRIEFRNVGDLYVDGWEFVLSGTSIQRRNVSLDTKLIWSDYNADLHYADWRLEPIPGTEIGSSNPDWRSSLLNQLTIGRFFTTFLIDMQKGGSVITYDFESFPTPQTVISDGSMTRLRDISAGYVFLKNADNKTIRGLQLSLSFRNIWLMYTKAERDLESYTIPQKSANLSLSLTL